MKAVFQVLFIPCLISIGYQTTKTLSLVLFKSQFINHIIKLNTISDSTNKIVLGFFLFLVTFYLSSTENTTTDSLLRIWNNKAFSDSLRIHTYSDFIRKKYLFTNNDSALILAQHLEQFSNEKNYPKGAAISLHLQGLIHHVEYNFNLALKYYNQSLEISEKINNYQGIASELNNIGLIYEAQDEYEKALDYYSNSLKYHFLSEDSLGVAVSYNNLATTYRSLGNYDLALEYHQNNLKIKAALEGEKGTALALCMIGKVYQVMEVNGKAKEFYKQSINVDQKFDQDGMQAYSNIGLGEIYLIEKNYPAAKKQCLKAYEIAFRNNYLPEIKNACNCLYQVYKVGQDSAKALLYLEIINSIEDSLKKTETVRLIQELEFAKQIYADSLEAAQAQKISQAQITAQKAQLKQEKTQRYGLIGGLILLLIFGAIMYNRFKITRQQKDIIELQKEEVEEAHEMLSEKNKEILDSIAYAKRIQSAILPPLRIVKEQLTNSFILYKPKDVVAGDFYWMESHKDWVYFAAADCTGHGVPGAMVSVICVNGLNRAVREFGLTEPGEILDKTRELVIKEFEKSEDDVKDGMDISLCALNTSTNSLKWAGANNPLWLMRKGANEMEEIKADKQPIGKHFLGKPFQTHQIQLQKGDLLYLFSDGFADQFGGEKGKKFKSLNFKRLLISLKSIEMEEQKKAIDEAFETWKGNLEQIDDVCVIGVQV